MQTGKVQTQLLPGTDGRLRKGGPVGLVAVPTVESFQEH